MNNDETVINQRVGVSAEGHRLARELAAQRGEPIYVAVEYACRLALAQHEAAGGARDRRRKEAGSRAFARRSLRAALAAVENCLQALADLGWED